MAHALKNKAKMSDLQSNRAQRTWESQLRIDGFKKSTEDGFQQRLAEGSTLPPGELARAQVIHGPYAPSLHTTDLSEAGGSKRASSVAPSTTDSSSEAPKSYSPNVFKPRAQHRCHVSIHEVPNNRTGRTGNDGIGDKAFDKIMRLPQEDGTVRTCLVQQASVLECPWGRMTGCKTVFLISEFKKWVAHTKKVHLSKEGRRGAKPIYIGPPASNNCGFCPAKFEADSGDLSWSNMMAHVAKEHHMLGHRLAHARIVWPLVEYLWEKGLLTNTQYKDLKPIKNAQDVPSPPGLSDDEDPIALVEERRHRGGQ